MGYHLHIVITIITWKNIVLLSLAFTAAWFHDCNINGKQCGNQTSMDKDYHRARARYIAKSLEVRNQLSFADPEIILKALQIFCMHWCIWKHAVGSWFGCSRILLQVLEHKCEVNVWTTKKHFYLPCGRVLCWNFYQSQEPNLLKICWILQKAALIPK